MDKINKNENPENIFRISDEIYQSIVENSNEGIVIGDFNGKIVFANQRWYDLIGYPKKEVLGKIGLDFMDKEQKKLVLNTRQEIKRGESISKEFKFIKKDGAVLWTLCNSTKLYDNQGKCLGILAMHTDITERKKEDEELKISQKLAGIGRWSLDIVNNKLTWSSGIYELFGLDPNKFNATYEAFLNSVHPDDRNFVNKAYKNSLKDRKPYDITHRLVGPNGKVLYVREICETIYNKEGKPIISKGIVQNITKIKEAEEEIKSLSRFPFENPNPVLRINSDGLVIYANPASKQILEDIKGKLGMVIPEFIKTPLFEAILTNKTMHDN